MSDIIQTLADQGYEANVMQPGHSKNFPELGLDVRPTDGNWGDHLASLVDIDEGKTVEEILGKYGVMLMHCLKLTEVPLRSQSQNRNGRKGDVPSNPDAIMNGLRVEQGLSWNGYPHKPQNKDGGKVGERLPFHDDGGSPRYVGLYNGTDKPRYSAKIGFADDEVVFAKTVEYDTKFHPFRQKEGIFRISPTNLRYRDIQVAHYMEKQGVGIYICLFPGDMVIWSNLLAQSGKLVHCRTFEEGKAIREEGNVMEKFNFHKGFRRNQNRKVVASTVPRYPQVRVL